MTFADLAWRQASLRLTLLVGLLCGTAIGEESPSPSAELTEPVTIRSREKAVDDADAPRVAAAAPPGMEHPLAPAIRLAQGSLTKLQTLKDYEATLLKRVRIDGRLVEQTMHLKLREQPLSVYLKFGEPDAGRELLYVRGRDGDKIWGHEGAVPQSLVGTVSLDPRGPEALRENRDPMTSIGMRNMLEAVISQWKQETPFGESDVQLYPDAKLRGRPCEVIEASHPRPRRQFQFQKTRLYIDQESRLPVRVEQYGFPLPPDQEPALAELYEYSNLSTNVGLADEDFNRHNPNYSF